MTTRRLHIRQIRRFLRLAVPVGLPLVALLAVAAGLYRLGSLPPGFLDTEAAHGLLARESAHERLALLSDAGDRSPLLANLIAFFGDLLDYDIMSARLGAVLAWSGSVYLTGRWLGSIMGPGWGLAGGALIASSFWPLLFGRLALSPVAGMLALSAFLLLIRKATSEKDTIVWYAAAGLAAGIAAVADPALRILPLIFVITALLVPRLRLGIAAPSPTGVMASMVAVSMVIIPYVADREVEILHITFWSATPGITTEPISSLSSLPANYAATLARLLWPGVGDAALNLPANALFGPLLMPWAVIGLFIVLGNLRSPLPAILSIWGALLLLPAALADPVHPGRLLPALPLLIILPLLSMRVLLRRTHQHRRLAAVLLISLTLVGNAVWSGWRYLDWAGSEQTAAAFASGTVSSLAMAKDLPGDEPIIYSTFGHPELLAYLGTEQAERIDIDGRQMLPIPVEQDGYLVVPNETAPDPALLALFDGIPPQTGDGYEIYRIDDRVRERLPLSVPTTRYSDDSVFLGHDLEPDEDGKLTVRLAWQFPSATSEHTVRLLQRFVDEDQVTQHQMRLPAIPIDGPYQLVMVMKLDPPPADSKVDLWVSLLLDNNTPISGDGVNEIGELFLNRYEFVR